MPLSLSGVAYFSMEVALEPSIPTYSGGLGILAGDFLRSAADLGLPLVGITLVHRKGYLHQHLDGSGNQTESPADWSPEERVELMKPVVVLSIEGRRVKIRAWRYLIEGTNGSVPVYLLDADHPDNTPEDRALTDHLYGGDLRYRLCQEVILGIGGVEILPLLGHGHIAAYHMNEGHSALLTLALLRRQLVGKCCQEATEADMRVARQQCVFTTHTPVPAGHDQFPVGMARHVLGPELSAALERTHCCSDGELNMTHLALFGSRYVNGVALQHGEVSREMFPAYHVRAITNGVHATTWVTPPFGELFDRTIPEWRRDNLYLRYACGIPSADIRAAHAAAKHTLMEEVRRRTGQPFDEKVFTLGFARRAAGYKRADLLFHTPNRLRWMAKNIGPIQVVFGGKSHPNDGNGKDLIRRVFRDAAEIGDGIRVTWLEDYDWSIAPLLYAGVDVWLNTPKRPQEASGTSGMKAALNGVPSFSVPDGWWIEGCLEGITGWAIGRRGDNATDDEEAASLYDKLECQILPLYYGNPNAWGHLMRSTIAVNGSFFNTQRMVSQYVANAYELQS
jgi:glycogen phosphorylase